MRISGVKGGEDQLTLFDASITAKGATRNHCGEFVERVAAELLGGKRLKTDSTCDYCPDLCIGPETYAETKCVGKTGHVILYRKRRENDRAFVQSGRTLFYFLYHHRAQVYAAETVGGLHKALASRLKYAALVDFETIDRLADAEPLRVLNRSKSVGYGRNGYGDGYTILASNIARTCRYSVTADLGFAVRGVYIGPMRIYCTPGGASVMLSNGYKPERLSESWRF